MALNVRCTPGKRFAVNEKITIPSLNQLGQPTFTVTGTVGTSEITDGSVTGDKTIPSDHFYTSIVSFLTGDYTLTYAPVPPLVDGMIIAFKANANGVPHATNGIRLVVAGTTKKLFKQKTETIVPGDIVANQIIEARYDTTGDGGLGAWQMTSHVSNPPSYYTATATGTNDYVLVLTPPASYPFVLADLDGKRIRFKVPNANTGAVTIALTLGGASLAAKPLKKNFNVALVADDLRQYQMAEIVYEANITASTDAYQLLTPVGATEESGMIRDNARDLVLQNNVSVPDSKVDITATEFVVKHGGSGRAQLLTAVNTSVDFTLTPGNAGALDTGAEAANTWYYIYIIARDDGTVSAVASVNPSAPTLPTLYTYYGLAGVVRGDGSANLVRFHQAGRRTDIAETNIFTARAPGAANTYEVLGAITAADLTAFRAAVPPIAVRCRGSIGSSTTAVSMTVSACGATGLADTSGIGANNCIGAAIGSVVNNFFSAGVFEVAVRGGTANYNIQWKAGGGTATNRMNISSFTF